MHICNSMVYALRFNAAATRIALSTVCDGNEMSRT